MKPFEGNHYANVALCENKFDTDSLQDAWTQCRKNTLKFAKIPPSEAEVILRDGKVSEYCCL